MNNFRIVTADQLDESMLRKFLNKVYSKKKSEFLSNFGSGSHRGNQNRLVALKDEEVVPYSAIIPMNCLLKGSNLLYGGLI